MTDQAQIMIEAVENGFLLLIRNTSDAWEMPDRWIAKTRDEAVDIACRQIRERLQPPPEAEDMIQDG